ncbi:MAG: c-type cytochrome [Kastovskya adunca ATA6-11-RM4]|nr:c-type cytochrome [Kastovskya adunca ATA6-11-RM4]
MKKIVSIVWVAIALFTVVLSQPAFAANTVKGGSIFGANCAACHLGGRNIVVASKTLKKAALEKYGMNSLEAITNQVKNGKNSMPAFRRRLNEQQIEDVAAYVLEQAEKGWH